MKFAVFSSGAKRLSDAEKLSRFPDSAGVGEGVGGWGLLSAVLKVKKSQARYLKLPALIEQRCRLYKFGKCVYRLRSGLVLSSSLLLLQSPQ